MPLTFILVIGGDREDGVLDVLVLVHLEEYCNY